MTGANNRIFLKYGLDNLQYFPNETLKHTQIIKVNNKYYSKVWATLDFGYNFKHEKKRQVQRFLYPIKLY